MSAVSVIVPVYNTEKYLEECIRSLTEQTLSSLELIFVDDGSTDASPKILERYRARDPEHIRVITQKNAGQGKARNVGLAAATGEYVGFVDSDDYVDRRMYAAMYTRAGSEELDLVECDFHYLEEDGREKRSYGSAAPWNKLIRRRLLTDNDIWFPESIGKGLTYIGNGRYSFHFFPWRTETFTSMLSPLLLSRSSCHCLAGMSTDLPFSRTGFPFVPAITTSTASTPSSVTRKLSGAMVEGMVTPT